MGYLFAALTIIGRNGKAFCSKKVSTYTRGYGDATWFNIVRMVICMAIGALLMLAGGTVPFVGLSATMVWISVLSAVSTAVVLVLWLVLVRVGAFVMIDAFITLGVAATVLCSRVFLGEPVRPVQYFGIALLVVASYVMCAYSSQIKARLSPMTLLLLVVCGLANGVSDFTRKLFVARLPEGNVAAFNFYCYLFTALVLLAALPLLRRQDGTVPEEKKPKIAYLYVALTAWLLFLFSFAQTKASALLPASVLFPLVQGIGLVITAATGALCFKERITGKCVAGLAMTFAALLIINFL